MTEETVDNSWANGCKACNYGVVAAPELTGAVEFYMERLAHAMNGDITFCDCRAGTSYRENLIKRHGILVAEARKDPRMTEQAKRGSHPDIETAQVAILEKYAKMYRGEGNVPTIRFVEEPAAVNNPNLSQMEPA